MNDSLVIIGLIVVAILVLIPVLMVGRLVYVIVAGYRDDRRAEARKITRTIPELGKFATTDNRLWFGEVRGMLVSLDSPDQPPTELQAKQALVLLDDLPALMEKAQYYLIAHEDTSWLDAGGSAFEPYGIELNTATNFVLEVIHPTDADGVYRIEFQDGVPVNSGRDD